MDSFTSFYALFLFFGATCWKRNLRRPRLLGRREKNQTVAKTTLVQDYGNSNVYLTTARFPKHKQSPCHSRDSTSSRNAGLSFIFKIVELEFWMNVKHPMTRDFGKCKHRKSWDIHLLSTMTVSRSVASSKKLRWIASERVGTRSSSHPWTPLRSRSPCQKPEETTARWK